MGYLGRATNYPKRIILFDPTYMMSMVDPVAISVGIPMIDSGCSFEKDFTELMCINTITPSCQSS